MRSGGWEHGWREERGGDADLGGVPLQQGERRPLGGLLTDIREAMEDTCAGALPGGAGEDGVLEHLRFQTAAGARALCLWGPPGGVGSQVTFPGSRQVDAPCCKLVQTHQGARV